MTYIILRYERGFCFEGKRVSVRNMASFPLQLKRMPLILAKHKADNLSNLLAGIFSTNINDKNLKYTM